MHRRHARRIVADSSSAYAAAGSAIYGSNAKAVAIPRRNMALALVVVVVML